jgi:hypothetical protein
MRSAFRAQQNIYVCSPPICNTLTRIYDALLRWLASPLLSLVATPTPSSLRFTPAHPLPFAPLSKHTYTLPITSPQILKTQSDCPAPRLLPAEISPYSSDLHPLSIRPYPDLPYHTHIPTISMPPLNHTLFAHITFQQNQKN